MDDGFQPLLSPRLKLRRLQVGDEAALCAYRALPEVGRYQYWESFQMAEAVQFVAEQAGMLPNVPGTWLQLAIVTASDDRIIGDCGLHFCAEGEMEIGITIDPQFQRRGYGKEVIGTLLPYAFDTLSKKRVVMITDAENVAAQALITRCGFELEATREVIFKGREGRELLFAIETRKV